MSPESTKDGRESKDCDTILNPKESFRNGFICFNMATNFASSWEEQEAFRDFMQNCTDECLRSHNLKRNDLLFELPRDYEPPYEIKIFSRKLRRCLAYIRFSECQNGNCKVGTLEITNYEARITRENLQIGASEKRKNVEMTGAHGEGLKIAALAMNRNRHPTTIRTSGFHLHFESHSKKGFGCRVLQSRARMIPREGVALEKSSEESLPFVLPKADIYRDVSVEISNVNFTKFKGWLKLCLDLEGPVDMLDGPNGSIILDPRLSGRIYHKHLLVWIYDAVRKSVDVPTQLRAKRFKYGYNLYQGELNRDRHSFTIPGQEDTLIFLCWRDLIISEANLPQAEKPAIKAYVTILREMKEHGWADLRNVESYFEQNFDGKAKVVSAIWKHLKLEIENQESFYYGPENVDRDVEIIKENLMQEPIPLPSLLWTPLSKYSLVRTPPEQQRQLLIDAPIASIEANNFSETVLRLLRGTFELDGRISRFTISQRAGSETGLDLLMKDSEVLIHKRWFDFHECHAWSPCQISNQASVESAVDDGNNKPFLCDHVITYLYGLLLKELSPGSGYRERSAMDRQLCTMISDCLAQMPRNVKVAPGSRQGSLEVSWVDIASERFVLHGFQLKCRIILHKSTCEGKKEELFAQFSIPEIDIELGGQTEAECGCPKQSVLQKDSKACFFDLDLQKEYYPMVASQSTKAFYASPPTAIRPKQVDDDPVDSGGSINSSSPFTDLLDQHEGLGIDQEIYDETESDSRVESMDVDIVAHRQSSNMQEFIYQGVPIRHNPSIVSSSNTSHSDMSSTQPAYMMTQTSEKAHNLVDIETGRASDLQNKQFSVVQRNNQNYAAIRGQQYQCIPAESGCGRSDGESDISRNTANLLHSVTQQAGEPVFQNNEVEAESGSISITSRRPSHFADSRKQRQYEAQPHSCTCNPTKILDQFAGPQDSHPFKDTAGPKGEGKDFHRIVIELQAEVAMLHAEATKLRTENAEMRKEREEAQRLAEVAYERGWDAARREIHNTIHDTLASINSEPSKMKKLSLRPQEWRNGEVVDLAAGSDSELVRRGDQPGESGADKESGGDGHGDGDGDIMLEGRKHDIRVGEDGQENGGHGHVAKKMKLGLGDS